MFNKFPYTDFHEMNCDEIIRMMKETREELTKVIEKVTYVDDKIKDIDNKIAVIDKKVAEGVATIQEVINEAREIIPEIQQIYQNTIEAGQRAENSATYVEDVVSDATPAITAYKNKKYLFIFDTSKSTWNSSIPAWLATALGVPTASILGTPHGSYGFSGGTTKYSAVSIATYIGCTDVIIIGGYNDHNVEIIDADVAAAKAHFLQYNPNANITYMNAFKFENEYSYIESIYKACSNNGIGFIDVSYAITRSAYWSGSTDSNHSVNLDGVKSLIKAISSEIISHGSSYLEHFGADLRLVSGLTKMTPSYAYAHQFNFDVSKEYTYIFSHEIDLKPSGSITMNMTLGKLAEDIGNYKPRNGITESRYYCRIALQNWGDITGTYDGYIVFRGDTVDMNMQGVPGVATGDTPIAKAGTDSFITIYPASSSVPTPYIYGYAGQ